MTASTAFTIEVDNPRYERGHPEELRRVTVVRALRDDPLGRLHARRQIGHAQYRAGRAWQEAYEAAAIGHIGSINPENEPVDCGGRFNGPNLDRITKAARKLSQWDRLLGQEGAVIVRRILVHRSTTEGIAQIHQFGDAEYYGKRFRECLTSLAKVMGYA